MKSSTFSNKFLLLLAFLVISVHLIAPAYALSNITTNESYVTHDEPYTPFPIFIVMVALGVLFLVISLLLPKKESNADAFATLAIIPLFSAAWMGNQLDFSESGVVGTATDNAVINVHHIHPAWGVSIFFGVLGLIAIAQLIRILTSPSNVQEPMGRSAPGSDDQGQEDDNQY